MVIWVKNIQNELMVEMYCKSLVIAIGKVLHFAGPPIKTHKGDEKWPLFVNKWLFCRSALITLDNNKDVLTDFYPYFSLYTLPCTSDWLYFYRFFSLKKVDH